MKACSLPDRFVEWIAWPAARNIRSEGMRIARCCEACLLIVVLLAGCPVAAAAVASAATDSADFYVATTGRDDWSGRLPAPNEARTDGPFATIARARDAVRQEKRTVAKKDFVVLFRGGIYRLAETVVFSLDDAAPQGGIDHLCRVSRRAADPQLGRPRSELASSERWTRKNLPDAAHGKVWVADLPPQLERVSTLYDGEVRLPRARGEGFAPVDTRDKTTAADTHSRFPPGALPQLAGPEAKAKSS